MKYRIEVQQVFGSNGKPFDTDAEWLEVDAKPRGLAAAKEALKAQVEKYKNGAPHRIVAISGETREVVEVLAYESPLAGLIRDGKADALASRIVGHCFANGLELDGLATELGQDLPLDQARATRLVEYCVAHTLGLNGMVDEVRALFNIVEPQPQVSEVIECVAMTVTYRDGSSGRYPVGADDVVEREGDTYTVFSRKGGPAFSYEVGHACVTGIEIHKKA